MNRNCLSLLFSSVCLFANAGELESPQVTISGGTYQRPLEKGAKLRTVAPYQLDVRQTNNAEFLAFVIAHPEWRRSQVNRLFADQGYLSHWAGDTALGPSAPPEAPVVNISWHAARAFLKSVGKRLPTVDEWEFAARADAYQADASRDPAFKALILDWYAKPTPSVLPAAGSQPPNFYGVRGLHGIVWEWTQDFVSAMTSGEARSDGTQDAQLFCGGGGADPNQATEYANFMRIAFRSSLQGDFCLPGLGFRGARDTAQVAAPAHAALPQGSIYGLRSTWIDQHEIPHRWADSLGTPRVIALGYATCKGICPRLIADMQRIEAGIPADSKTRFTFITLDPANDLQPQMKALEARSHMDPKRWDLLRGAEDDLLELAVTLGIRFNRLPNGIDFAHSYLIAVIGPDGRILHKWTDPADGADPSIQVLRALKL